MDDDNDTEADRIRIWELEDAHDFTGAYLVLDESDWCSAKKIPIFDLINYICNTCQPSGSSSSCPPCPPCPSSSSSHSSSSSSSSSGGCNWVVEAHTAAQGTSGGLTTSSIDTSTSNLIVVASVYYAGSAEPTISDSQSNTWTPLTSYSSGTSRVRFKYCYTPSRSATHTFSSTGASSFPALAVIALSCASFNPFDVENGGGAVQPGSITPSFPAEIILTAITDDNPAAIANSIDSGFIVTDHLTNSAGNAFGVAMAYLIQTSPSAVNPTWSGGSGSSVCNIAVFA